MLWTDEDAGLGLFEHGCGDPPSTLDRALMVPQVRARFVRANLGSRIDYYSTSFSRAALPRRLRR